MIELSSIESAIEDIRAGKMIVAIDDECRENEGDLIMSAEKVTPAAINFMATYGRGLICAPILKSDADRFGLELMVKSNNSQNETAFTVSIDLLNGGTGISCKDRSDTVLALTNDESTATTFAKPGHIFPLIAKDDGVLVRDGHTEAAVDFARLAGHKPVGLICEILSEDGTMSRGEELFLFAKKHDLKMVSIADLIKYRKRFDTICSDTDAIDFPNKYGEGFKLKVFESTINSGEHHVAIYKGEITSDEPLLTRVHSECFTGDLFGSLRCECGDQLESAMRAIDKLGRGLILYMRQEGRGIGLPNKIKAYRLQDGGLDTVDANIALGFDPDMRDYSFAAQMIKKLNIESIRLMTNNPEKVNGLREFGIDIAERVPTEICVHEHNLGYMEVKRDRMGHMLPEKLNNK
ncbi:MAG: GTP cyclohydrolase II [Bacteriovoracaceae bacterium]|nr:GTP cyclohydrolase II [Bacteriovoracaceae bacterium]